MSKFKDFSLSVLVSALNEEDAIAETVDDIKTHCESWELDYEMVIVNDGSSDKTGEILEELAASDDKLKIITNNVNRGMGYSVRRALDASTKDWFTMLPGDNEIAIRSLEEFLEIAEDFDLITGYFDDAGESRHLIRQLMSSSYHLVQQSALGIKTKYSNGLWLMRSDLAKKLPIVSNRFTWQSELLSRATRVGARITELPFHRRGRLGGVTKAASVRSVVNAMASMIELTIEFRWIKKPEIPITWKGMKK